MPDAKRGERASKSLLKDKAHNCENHGVGQRHVHHPPIPQSNHGCECGG